MFIFNSDNRLVTMKSHRALIWEAAVSYFVVFSFVDLSLELSFNIRYNLIFDNLKVNAEIF